MTQGFLYVLTNPAMPGLIKVGKTTRLPNERVSELSSATGVPSPFLLVYEQPVSNCHDAEAWVHRQLELVGRRHSKNREFFEAPLHVVVKAVFDSSSISFASSLVTPLKPDPGQDGLDQGEIALYLYAQACLEQRGDANNLPNPGRALALYQEAARLGHSGAVSVVLEIAVKRRDWDGALEMCGRIIDAGDWTAEVTRAYIFEQAGHRHLAEERMIVFFQTVSERLERQELPQSVRSFAGAEALAYVETVADDKSKAYLSKIQFSPVAPLVIEAIDTQLTELEKVLKGPSPAHDDRIKRNRLLRFRRKAEMLLAGL